MGFIASEDYLQSRRKIQDELVTPAGGATDMRSTVLLHMNALVRDQNARIRAKFHYMETGEVLRDDIRDVVPFLPRTNPAKHHAAARFFYEFVELPQGLDSLTDADVLRAYGELLLRLREIRLPDPDPA